MTDNSITSVSGPASETRSIAIPIIGLGITQILGYGTLYYAFAVLEPHISREFGWPSSWSFGCLSLALLTGGLAGPFAGRFIDERGARLAMSLGSIASAIALVITGDFPGSDHLRFGAHRCRSHIGSCPL